MRLLVFSQIYTVFRRPAAIAGIVCGEQIIKFSRNNLKINETFPILLSETNKSFLPDIKFIQKLIRGNYNE